MATEDSATSKAMGIRSHRQLRHRYWPQLLIGSFCGCLCGCAGNPATSYSRGDAQRRAGDLPRALKEAEAGRAAWNSETQSEWHWKFRLLAAEILLMQGEAQKALPLLQDEPP